MYGGSAVNCSFVNNTARYDGGAMYESSAVNCSFVNNTAAHGGAMNNCLAMNCSFVNNHASLYGDAMKDSSAVNCSFINNNVYHTQIQFYIINDGILYLGDTALFYGLPECNLTVNVTNDGKSKTFNCTDKGWKVEDLKAGIYTVTFTIKTYNNNNGRFTTTITVLPGKGKFIPELNTLINSTENDTIILNDDYYCIDKELENGIIINKSVTIDGQGHKIDANGLMRIFQVTNSANVTFKNIIFTNGHTPISNNENGSAVWNNGAKNVTAINCTFDHNYAYYGGAIYNVSAVNCSFVNNTAEEGGGAMRYGSAVNCTFVNNTAKLKGGAICDGSAANCSLVNNTSMLGGAMYESSAVNCTFVNNTAEFGGAMNRGPAVNCSFINNTVEYKGFESNAKGEAMYDGTVTNCSFINNNVYYTHIQFYIINKNLYLGNTALFYGLPECNLTVNVTKDGVSKTFNCTNKGWEIENIDPGRYTVTFTIKSDNENNGEITTKIDILPGKGKVIQELNTLINSTENDTIILNDDYYCVDKELENGIIINKSVTIDGQGHKIDARGLMRIFRVTNGATVTFKNILFLNGWTGARTWWCYLE